jgi:Haem-degrading
MKVLGAAVGRAHALDCHVSIAVVDDDGHLIAFTRSEKAELYSIALAQAKAKSAALTRFPSGKKSPTGNERDDHHALAIALPAGGWFVCHDPRRLSSIVRWGNYRRGGRERRGNQRHRHLADRSRAVKQIVFVAKIELAGARKTCLA